MRKKLKNACRKKWWAVERHRQLQKIKKIDDVRQQTKHQNCISSKFLVCYQWCTCVEQNSFTTSKRRKTRPSFTLESVYYTCLKSTTQLQCCWCWCCKKHPYSVTIFVFRLHFAWLVMFLIAQRLQIFAIYCTCVSSFSDIA